MYADIGANGQAKFWHLPKNSVYGKADLRSAFRLWVLGISNYEFERPDGKTINSPIRPFQSIDPQQLPKRLRKAFNIGWKPVLDIMSRDIVSLPTVPGSIDNDMLNELYQEGI